MPDLRLVTYVTAATDHEIEDSKIRLGAIDMKVEGTDAVREFWADEPERPLPSSISVQFTPRKKN